MRRAKTTSLLLIVCCILQSCTSQNKIQKLQNNHVVWVDHYTLDVPDSDKIDYHWADQSHPLPGSELFNVLENSMMIISDPAQPQSQGRRFSGVSLQLIPVVPEGSKPAQALAELDAVRPAQVSKWLADAVKEAKTLSGLRVWPNRHTHEPIQLESSPIQTITLNGLPAQRVNLSVTNGKTLQKGFIIMFSDPTHNGCIASLSTGYVEDEPHYLQFEQMVQTLRRTPAAQ